MHEESQYGIASHIIYTESNKPKQGGILRPKLNWIKNLIDWQKQTEGSEEFLTTLKTDFFEDQIFTFTPKGDVIELPVGATVIDFAYAIHSDLGNHASGGRINGKFSGLNTKLQNRDCVEIETKKSNRPTQKWLEFAKTSLARRHIRSFLQKVDES
jgi:GTP pyrophosphokinase